MPAILLPKTSQLTNTPIGLGPSHQFSLFEAEPPASDDDDVVEQTDLKDSSRFHESGNPTFYLASLNG